MGVVCAICAQLYTLSTGVIVFRALWCGQWWILVQAIDEQEGFQLEHNVLSEE